MPCSTKLPSHGRDRSVVSTRKKVYRRAQPWKLYTSDPTQPAHDALQLLPSGRRHRLITSKKKKKTTKCFRKSFLPILVFLFIYYSLCTISQCCMQMSTCAKLYCKQLPSAWLCGHQKNHNNRVARRKMSRKICENTPNCKETLKTKKQNPQPLFIVRAPLVWTAEAWLTEWKGWLGIRPKSSSCRPH